MVLGKITPSGDGGAGRAQGAQKAEAPRVPPPPEENPQKKVCLCLVREEAEEAAVTAEAAPEHATEEVPTMLAPSDERQQLYVDSDITAAAVSVPPTDSYVYPPCHFRPPPGLDLPEAPRSAESTQGERDERAEGGLVGSGRQRTASERELLKFEKKLRQVAQLQLRLQAGERLDQNQHEKINQEAFYKARIAELSAVTAARKDEDDERETENDVQQEEYAVKVRLEAEAEERTAETVEEVAGGALPRPPRAPPGLENCLLSADSVDAEKQCQAAYTCRDCHDPQPEKNDLIPNKPLNMVLSLKQMAVLANREDSCWIWVQRGYCPRGAACIWKHPPLPRPLSFPFPAHTPQF
jgi:hypothetical protein